LTRAALWGGCRTPGGPTLGRVGRYRYGFKPNRAAQQIPLSPGAPCDAFHMFAMIIKEKTELSDHEVVELAGDLQEHILSEIIERLQRREAQHRLKQLHRQRVLLAG
jgi:hypothetical protein